MTIFDGPADEPRPGRLVPGYDDKGVWQAAESPSDVERVRRQDQAEGRADDDFAEKVRQRQADPDFEAKAKQVEYERAFNEGYEDAKEGYTALVSKLRDQVAALKHEAFALRSSLAALRVRNTDLVVAAQKVLAVDPKDNLGDVMAAIAGLHAVVAEWKEGGMSGSLDGEPLNMRKDEAVRPIDAEPMLQFFAYDHLPAHLLVVSRPFAAMATELVRTLPRNPERTVALRKLLEAKDCAVRAVIWRNS